MVTAKNSGEKVTSSVMRNQVGYPVIRLERKFMHVLCICRTGSEISELRETVMIMCPEKNINGFEK